MTPFPRPPGSRILWIQLERNHKKRESIKRKSYDPLRGVRSSRRPAIVRKAVAVALPTQSASAIVCRDRVGDAIAIPLKQSFRRRHPAGPDQAIQPGERRRKLARQGLKQHRGDPAAADHAEPFEPQAPPLAGWGTARSRSCVPRSASAHAPEVTHRARFRRLRSRRPCRRRACPPRRAGRSSSRGPEPSLHALQ